jgi:hypothetical protein
MEFRLTKALPAGVTLVGDRPVLWLEPKIQVVCLRGKLPRRGVELIKGW